MTLTAMIDAHPDVKGDQNHALTKAAQHASLCALICTSCADACLAEEMVGQLTQCIRLNLDCADVCQMAATAAVRQAGGNVELLRPLLSACIEACRRCAEECEGHAAHMEHCRICADHCRRCEHACREAMETVGQAAAHA